MAVTLRKKAPFFCRTGSDAGKSTCLVPLSDTDGNFCPACVTKEAARQKNAVLPIPRVEDEQAESRFITAAEWSERVARGPIWPI